MMWAASVNWTLFTDIPSPAQYVMLNGTIGYIFLRQLRPTDLLKPRANAPAWQVGHHDKILRNAYCVFQYSVKETRQRLCGEQVEPCRCLLPLSKHLPIGLAVGIKPIIFALLPRGFQVW